MRRRDLIIPLWMTCAFLIGVVWAGWDPWQAAAPTLRDWAPAILVAVVYVLFLAYWFGIRPSRRRRMSAWLQQQGYFDRSLDDPSLVAALEALFPTPFAPQVRQAVARDLGWATRFVVHGSTMFHRDFPQRENRIEEWTYVLETRPLPVDADVYIQWQVDSRVGPMKALKERTAGLDPEFAKDFRVLAATETGPVPPKGLQDALLHPSHSSFIGTFCLRLTPRGWGFATLPVLSEPAAKRLIEFVDQLSAGIAGPVV
jgi:hypothetical protein